MNKNDLTPEEFTKLAIAVAGLPFVRPARWKTDYCEDVMHTVLNFHIQERVGQRNFFSVKIPRRLHRDGSLSLSG